MSRREIEIFTARAMLREARVRRHLGQFRMAETLLRWAANARRRAAESRIGESRSGQMEMAI